MLDGSYAKMTVSCNAIDAVKQVVRRSEGYIADKNWADGIAEALTLRESRLMGTVPPHIRDRRRLHRFEVAACCLRAGLCQLFTGAANQTWTF
jgi:hypothetical protein